MDYSEHGLRKQLTLQVVPHGYKAGNIHHGSKDLLEKWNGQPPICHNSYTKTYEGTNSKMSSVLTIIYKTIYIWQKAKKCTYICMQDDVQCKICWMFIT